MLALLAPPLVMTACVDAENGDKAQAVQSKPAEDEATDAASAEATPAGDRADASSRPHLLAGPGETCWFEALGTQTWCEDAGARNFINPQAQSLQDCADACVMEPTCTAIIDWFWLDDYPGPGCLLHTAGCDDTGPGVEESQSFFYRKVCGDDPPSDAIFDFAGDEGADAGGGDSGTAR